MKKLITLCTIGLLCYTQVSFATSSLEQKLERSYNRYINKLSSVSPTRKIAVLHKLDARLDVVLETKKLSTQKRDLLVFLSEINNDAIFDTIIKQDKQSFESIYNSHSSLTIFDKKIKNNIDVFLEDGVWYFYRYNKWGSFPNTTFGAHDLKANGFKNSNTLIDIRDNKVIFIKEFEKIRLIEDSIIDGVSNKYEFLKEVKDDKRFLSDNTDEYFKKLKVDTATLIGSTKKTEEKIQKIYNFVLNHVSYTEGFSLEDKEIFSGILSYSNRDGVCEGYSKLMIYMLGFAGVDDYEAIRGYVIDAPDFPQIGHAWVRIGDRYYDPTFDDPIGAKTTRTAQQYIYYNMPKDIFYTNRYHYDDLPEFLRSRSIDFRNKYINKRLSNLVSKYEGQNYIILKLFKFKKQMGIAYDTDITIENLKTILPYYQVVNNRLTQNGQALVIKSSGFSYYQITDTNIETLLKQIDYNTDGYFLLKLEDGSYGVGYGLE